MKIVDLLQALIDLQLKGAEEVAIDGTLMAVGKWNDIIMSSEEQM